MKKKNINTKHKKKKKKNHKKGFSMIELLAVIVILGIISTISIVSVSRLVDKSRDNYYETQQEQLVLAAQAYANDDKRILPKEIGAFSTVYLQELYDKNYISDKIVDQNKNECYAEKSVDSNGNIIEGSRVEIYKSSKTDYKYVGYLECYACKEDKSSKDSTCYDPKTRLGPEIEINIPDISGNNILNKNHKISITLKGNKTNNNIKVSSYSYKIYVDGVTRKSSGLVVNNKQDTVNINEELYKYVPGVVKVVVSTTNTDGISKSKSASRNLRDAVAPQCGRVTYEGANSMNAYNSGETKECGTTGYSWINIATNPGSRNGWVLCNDDYGVGCRQHEYSANMTTDGHNEIVKIMDKDGKDHDCSIKKCIDKTSPKITVSIKNGSTTNKTFTVNPQTSTVDYKPNDKYDTWLNKANYPNGVTVTVKVDDTTSQLKSFSWYQNLKNKKENQEGSATEKVDVASNINNSSYTKSQTITDDGVRKEVITVVDNAGNKVTYTLILKIDRTPPPVPTIYMYREDNTSAVATTTNYPNDKWKNKYVWTTTNKPADNPDVSGWKTNQYTTTGAHGTYTAKVGNDVHVSNEGITTITYRSCDYANNCSDNATAKTIKLDRQVPTCTVTNSGGTKGSGSWYKGGTVTATGKCTDQNNLSKCVNNTVEVQKVNSNSPNDAGTKKTKDVYDNAGNKATCSSTIKYDKSAPSCSISKTHTGTTDGVTLTTTCTDNGPSGIAQCEAKHTGVKQVKTHTYIVKDHAGNSNTCSKAVTSQRQRSDCSQCAAGSCSGSCASYEQVCSSWCCKAASTAGGTLHYVDQCSPSKPVGGRCPATSDAATCGGYTNGSCKSWNASCSKCGCNKWGGWYNVSSCNSSSSVQCQTLYK